MSKKNETGREKKCYSSTNINMINVVMTVFALDAASFKSILTDILHIYGPINTDTAGLILLITCLMAAIKSLIKCEV